MRINTKRIAVIALLSAIAYVIMVVGRIPVVLFLKYDPKDIIITIGGFLYGPLAAAFMSVVVSLVEMFTVSDSGPIGAVMNVISSCAFACTASAIYARKRDLVGAGIGLAVGLVLTTVIMLIWNYFVTPLYMGVSRDAVVALLVPAILPFNLIKYGLNAAFTMLLYNPVAMALQRAKLMPEPESTQSRDDGVHWGSILISGFVIATCVLFILVLQGIL